MIVVLLFAALWHLGSAKYGSSYSKIPFSLGEEVGSEGHCRDRRHPFLVSVSADVGMFSIFRLSDESPSKVVAEVVFHISL